MLTIHQSSNVFLSSNYISKTLTIKTKEKERLLRIPKFFLFLKPPKMLKKSMTEVSFRSSFEISEISSLHAPRTTINFQ